MIRDFGSFTRRGLLVDLEHPAEMWWGQIGERAGGEAGEETVEDRKTTDQSAVIERVRPKDSASLREMPLIQNALVSTA